MNKSRLVLIALGFVMTSALARADLMPSFADVPTGWTTDRYEPTSFANVGTFQGRSDVLGIRITSAGDFANRGSGYQTTFYNTQGRQHVAIGLAGSFISADLFIPQEWSNPANGNVRTDMWGVMTDGSAVSDYPIIGFTNYGGPARLRVWDDTGWVDLETPVAYDAWTSFTIAFTGTSYKYSINGNNVFTDATINGTTGFSNVIMQGYNFADPSISNTVLKDYTAHWSNTVSVPEPGFYSSVLSLGMGMGGLVYFARRRRKTSL
jgi:hypothetical protein